MPEIPDGVHVPNSAEDLTQLRGLIKTMGAIIANHADKGFDFSQNDVDLAQLMVQSLIEHRLLTTMQRDLAAYGLVFDK